MSFTIFLLSVGIAFALFGILALLLHKIRRVHIMLFSVPTKIDLENHYRQIEALTALYRDTGLTRALPPLRGYAASPDFLRVIDTHVRAGKPRNILELGSGASTLVLAQALRNIGRGHLWSVDHDEEYAKKTLEMLREHRLEDWVTVVNTTLTEQNVNGSRHRWYQLDALPPVMFDMLIVDGPPMWIQKHARYPALPLLTKKLSDHATVIVDDTAREEDAEVIARWEKEFPNSVFSHAPCEKGCVVVQYQAPVLGVPNSTHGIATLRRRLI